MRCRIIYCNHALAALLVIILLSPLCGYTQTLPTLNSTTDTATVNDTREESQQNQSKSGTETLFSKDYFKLLFEDTKYILTSPSRWEKKEWTLFSVAALGVGAVALLDKPVWDFMQRNQTHTLDLITDIASGVSGGYSLTVFIPFYVAGKTWGNTKAVETALDGWSVSLIASGIISPGLKFIAGRSPPKDNEGTFRFRPFTYRFQFGGGPQSFPSGHAAQSFGIASVIASHYEEPWVKITAYTLAALTSASRLYQGVHFASDFAAGAIIGTAVGTTVVHFNEKRRKERKEQTVFLTPLARPCSIGLNVTVRLQ